MRSVLVDKIASVAVQADLGQEIRVSADIPCEEGVLIAVEVLNNKSRYNTVELTSGRMPRSRRVTSSSARSATAKRCSATRAICRRSSSPATSCSS